MPATTQHVHLALRRLFHMSIALASETTRPAGLRPPSKERPSCTLTITAQPWCGMNAMEPLPHQTKMDIEV
ncbi:hypothetical protein VDGE_30391 [Verticillium dahliae]|uniref:Uncharacterized protein n=1 Tax=Verticillium dahliae TaxID=27337 RepID=A0A444RRB4_VERDA|nr:hypothetical protein VDGE_30391 [Verticillium dahliae]